MNLQHIATTTKILVIKYIQEKCHSICQEYIWKIGENVVGNVTIRVHFGGRQNTETCKDIWVVRDAAITASMPFSGQSQAAGH